MADIPHGGGAEFGVLRAMFDKFSSHVLREIGHYYELERKGCAYTLLIYARRQALPKSVFIGQNGKQNNMYKSTHKLPDCLSKYSSLMHQDSPGKA